MKHTFFAAKALLKLTATGIFSISMLMNTSTTFAQIASQPQTSQPGYYRLPVGDFEVIALSDGTVPQNFRQLLTNVKPGEIDRLLKLNYQTDPVELSVNGYLIKKGNDLILVDAGTAEAYGPTLGHLTESLRRAGYQPEQISAVLITHIHIDHTGGLMDKGKLAFPNATIYISKPEIDFWLTAESKRKAPEGLKNYFVQAKATVGPYLKAGKVKTFEYDKEILPGILPLASPGHTPGHTFFSLESKGMKMLFWGDILHAAAIQFADPAVTIVYDVDPSAAAAQRKKAFREAAINGYLVAADHLSYPGIGRIRTEGKSYLWVPVNYSTLAEAH
jgi:glyoxylase-like metal-dependent hydrolase (beta-lactamase superfamily II)